MIKILDTTLREGEQTPNVKFTLNQKVEIAKRLDEFGVDYIEAGMPIISDYDFQAVKAVANLGLRAEVLGHARAREKDIDAVAKSGCSWIGIFCGVNELSRTHKLNGKSEQEVYQMIADSIKYAKQKGLKVRYTAEDATRTSKRDLIQIAKLAKSAGADRFSIADTVGCAFPKRMCELISALRGEEKIPLEVHCHNDLGLALANSLEAYNSSPGVEVIDASVNGIGERAGITSLQELSLALKIICEENARKLELLPELSRLVESYSNIRLDKLRPVTGENAFTHTARLHRLAVGQNPACYELISPEIVGRSRK